MSFGAEDTQEASERTFLEYCSQLIARELAELSAAQGEEEPQSESALISDQIRQRQRIADLVEDLLHEDRAEPLEPRLDRRIRALQRQAMQLASQVYGSQHYPADYWSVDEERGLLTELLSAWHNWNTSGRIDHILSV